MKTMLCFLAAVALGTSALPRSRSFELSYTAKLPATAAGAPVRVWIPVPQSGWDQTVEDLKINSPVPAQVTTEPTYGNKMMYVELPAGTPPAALGWTAKVTRREHLGGGVALTSLEVLQLARLLADENKMVVHAPQVKLALAKATKGLAKDQKPRAVYDYVVGNMVYDKNTPGWGQGDTLRACSVGKGNCTDFHSLFISMVREAQIPAKFAIGFSLPKAPGGEVQGYHCWAYFLSSKQGWVPIDASEAFKHPELKDYYFGNLTADRVELTQGRDLNLEPRQAGPSLNYFLNPYAEQGGKALAGTDRKVSIKEL